MKFHKINVFLFLLATAVSAYLVKNHYVAINASGSFHSFCSLSKTIDCDLVNSSRYSEYFGVPIATIGFAYSLFALILNFLAWKNPFFRREALAALLPLGALSVAASVANLALSVWGLQIVCIFCMAHQALCLLTFVLTILAARDFGGIRPFNRKKVASIFAGGVVLTAISVAASLQLEESFPFDKKEFLSEFQAQPSLSVPIGSSPKLGFQGEKPALQLVEFSDFQCPFCAMAAKHMHRLVHMYADKIQLVAKNFPLSSECNPAMTVAMHAHSCAAARAAICANAQGKYLEFAEKLFENQKLLNPDALKTWASEVGMDPAAFSACLDSPATRDLLNQDVMLGKSLNVQSTPTFFVNGKKIEGLIDERRLRALLKEYE